MTTLDKITKRFTKTLKQLDSFITQKDIEIAGAIEERQRLIEVERWQVAQKERAEKIKKNIEGIIS